MKSKRYYVSTPVSKTLKEKLEKLAKSENRKLAQFVRIYLTKLAHANGNGEPA